MTVSCTNIGTDLWVDGFIGTKDDSSMRRHVPVHNRAFEILFSHALNHVIDDDKERPDDPRENSLGVGQITRSGT